MTKRDTSRSIAFVRGRPRKRKFRESVCVTEVRVSKAKAKASLKGILKTSTKSKAPTESQNDSKAFYSNRRRLQLLFNRVKETSIESLFRSPRAFLAPHTTAARKLPASMCLRRSFGLRSKLSSVDRKRRLLVATMQFYSITKNDLTALL